MSASPNNVNQLVDHLFRNETGKIISILTRVFGLQQMEVAEDIVQETLMDALNQWSVRGIPENPSAWLMQVAKNKTVNTLKREGHARKYAEHELHVGNRQLNDLDQIFLEDEIKDSQLRMIFTCCHPALPIESQIALTLKTLCGFSVPEIAHSLLTTTANVNKRLYRAKQKFREENIAYELPPKDRLAVRLDAVYLALYLLFNSGYNSSHNEKLIREDLCVEAIRLGTILTEQIVDQPKCYALLALMYLHTARFDARLDKKGGIIIFEDQDRNLWDSDMINTGLYYLNKGAFGNSLSEYHLEAGIAAEHCLAKSFETTNWQNIYNQYKLLYSIKNNPVIELNMAIILSQTDGVEASIEQLTELEKSGKLESYYLLAATLGTFHLQQGNKKQAKTYFEKAMQQTQSKTELQLLQEKLEQCN